MKTIQDVLRAKEAQLQQIQKEIEALKLAARLVEESETASVRATTAAPAPQLVMRPAAQPAIAPSAWDASKPQFP